MNNLKGIGLIEVLVTIAITTIGLLGLSAMQMQSIRSVSDTGNRTHAIWVANDLINRIRANKTAFDDYVTNEISCKDENGASNIPEIKMCASYSQDGNQVAPADDCSNADLAEYDLWESLCGIEAITGAGAFTSSASFMINPALTIEDMGNGDMTLTLSWNSRTAGRDEAGKQVYYVEKGSLAAEQREDYSVVFRP